MTPIRRAYLLIAGLLLVGGLALAIPINSGPVTSVLRLLQIGGTQQDGVVTVNLRNGFTGSTSNGVATVDSVGLGGTVTSVATGTGLTGGPITTSGTVSLSTPVSVANGGTGLSSAGGVASRGIYTSNGSSFQVGQLPNAALANSSIGFTLGTGLTSNVGATVTINLGDAAGSKSISLSTPLTIAQGGTNTTSAIGLAGSLAYSTGSAYSWGAGSCSANTMIRSGGSSGPGCTTATWLSTINKGEVVTATANNVVGVVAPIGGAGTAQALLGHGAGQLLTFGQIPNDTLENAFVYISQGPGLSVSGTGELGTGVTIGINLAANLYGANALTGSWAFNGFTTIGGYGMSILPSQNSDALDITASSAGGDALYVTGAAPAYNIGIRVDNAGAVTFPGGFDAGTVTATSFGGSGAGLTNVPASSLTGLDGVVAQSCAGCTGLCGSFVADTGGTTAQKVVVLSGANKVKDAAASLSLTTVIGVATTTTTAGGTAAVCLVGLATVNSTDAACTAGALASTSAGTAGSVQCVVAVGLGAGVGKISTSQSGSTATIYVNPF